MKTINTMPEINEYEKQANDFLKATNTSFHTSYKRHDYYFPDDKEARDIYYITLKNSSHRYRFTFGQSISNTGITPTAYDVLTALTKYDPYSFENFCADYGYDCDSRKAEGIYKAVCKEWENVNKLFTSEQIELLQEIS